MNKTLIPIFAFSIFLATSAQASTFSIKSSSFTNQQNIPALYTCDGRDISPQVAWSGAPAKTQALVIICEDPDAPAGVWYHWVVYNIPSAVTEIPEGAGITAGAAYGTNSFGKAQYNGPCPPPSSVHHYHFTLYALDSKLSLSPGASAKTVLEAMQGHVLAKTSIMGVFGH